MAQRSSLATSLAAAHRSPTTLAPVWAGRWKTQLARHANYLFVAPMLIYTAALMLYPIVMNLQMSVYDVTVMTFLRGNSAFVGLGNYAKLLHDPAFVKAVTLSLAFTVVSISLQFTFGFALALFFNRPFPGNGFLRAMLLLAWLLPAVVVGNIFRWLLDGDYGPLNFFLADVGLLHAKQYWLLEPATALAGVIMANAWVGIPFNMMLLLAGLQTIPAALYEAATIDGAGPWRRFLSITLPQMRPVILGVLLICFIYTFKVFDLVFIMTRGGPVDATLVLPIYAYKLTFDFFRFGDGAAASTVLLLGLLALALGYARLIRAEEAA
jgi:multiple sugar transport system permease protein